MLITNILLALLVAGMSIISLICWIKYRKLVQQFYEFVTPVAENEFSPLGQTVDGIATQIARAIVAQAKATFMAQQSAAVRGESTVEADIQEDMLSMANPLIGGILNQFPTLRKTLRRNPALAGMAMEKLAGFAAKAKGNNHSQETSQVKFKL